MKSFSLLFTAFSTLAVAQNFNQSCKDLELNTDDIHDPVIKAVCPGPDGDVDNALHLNDCYGWNSETEQIEMKIDGNAFHETCEMDPSHKSAGMYNAYCNGKRVVGELTGLTNRDGKLVCEP